MGKMGRGGIEEDESKERMGEKWDFCPPTFKKHPPPVVSI